VALTDSELLKDRRTKRRALDAKGKHWSDSQKLEAVQTYLMLGSVRMTSAALKIPEVTLKLWRSSAWWKDLESELKIQDELQLSTRLKKIAEKSFAAVEDRLEHGNFVFDQKTGKIRRIPVNLKDAHKVAIESIQQQELIANKHVEVANDGQILNKLEQLAAKFAEMATDKFKQIQDEPRTVEMADVVQEDDDDADEGTMGEDEFGREAGIQTSYQTASTK
jgi:transposase-like protein